MLPINLAHLPGNRLPILQKLTRFKHTRSLTDLLTLAEFNSLPSLLKGYAFVIEQGFPGSAIPAREKIIVNENFLDGERYARSEFTRLKNFKEV